MRFMMALDMKRPVADLVGDVLFNISVFDTVAFRAWLEARPQLRDVANLRPPNRLYRIEMDAGRAHLTAASPRLGIIVGYVQSWRGMPAQCCVAVLGVDEGTGSPEEPYVMEPSALMDVTPFARLGQLGLERPALVRPDGGGSDDQR